jgi:hypothetical protein
MRLQMIKLSDSEMEPKRKVCRYFTVKNGDRLPEDQKKESTDGDRALCFRRFRSVPFRLLVH